MAQPETMANLAALFALVGKKGISTHLWTNQGKRYRIELNTTQGWGLSGVEDQPGRWKLKAWKFDRAKYREERMAKRKALKRARKTKVESKPDPNTYEGRSELMAIAAFGDNNDVDEEESSDEDDILTSPDSKVVDADLLKILSARATWELFDEKDKAEIRALVPAHVPVDTEGLPTADWLKHNPYWQQDIRLFQNDLREGRLEPEWQEMAAQAMEDRANGNFDDWKEKNFEEFWGQKAETPVTSSAHLAAYQGGASTHVADGILVAGNEASSSTRVTSKAATVRFRQMVREQCFRVGDLWKYSGDFKAGDLVDRSFSNMVPDALVVVEKWVQVHAIDHEKGFITFLIPHGTLNTHPSSTNPSDNQLSDPLTSHIDLVKRILIADGRSIASPMRNAWNELQCYRGTQHLGSLFDLREALYASHNPPG